MHGAANDQVQKPSRPWPAMSTAVHGSPCRLLGPLQPRTIGATEEEEGDEEEEEEERDEEDAESIGGLGELMGPVPQTVAPRRWSGKWPTNIKSTGGPEALGGPRRARGAKQATRP